MSEKSYDVLELNKVLDLLAAQTTCADAADAAKALQPSTYLDEVRRLQAETDAAYSASPARRQHRGPSTPT